MVDYSRRGAGHPWKRRPPARAWTDPEDLRKTPPVAVTGSYWGVRPMVRNYGTIGVHVAACAVDGE